MLDKLDQGHCSQLGIARSTTEYILAWLTWYHPLNSVIPAFIYRLDRCDAGDRKAVLALWNNVFGGDGDLLGVDDRSFSQVLSQHVGLSELYWHTDFEGVNLDEYFTELDQRTLFAFGGHQGQWESYNAWPRYDEPLAKAGFANYAAPLLLMQGALDGATPLEQAAVVGQHFVGKHQSYVEFPYAPHNIHSGTPISKDDGAEHCGAEHCGMNIFQQFFRAPTAKLDVSCVANTRPPNFAGSAVLAQYIFNAGDYWEAVATVSGPRASVDNPSSELASAITALRRAIARSPLRSSNRRQGQ